MGFIQKAFSFIAHPTHSRTTMILIFVILAVAVPFTVIISQNKQTIKQRASGQNCEANYTSCTNAYNGCNQNCSSLWENAEAYSSCTDRCSTDQSKCSTDAYNVYLQCLASTDPNSTSSANSTSTISQEPSPTPSCRSLGTSCSSNSNCCSNLCDPTDFICVSIIATPTLTPTSSTTTSSCQTDNENCFAGKTCVGSSSNNSLGTFCLTKNAGENGSYCGTPNGSANNNACASSSCGSDLKCSPSPPTPTPTTATDPCSSYPSCSTCLNDTANSCKWNAISCKRSAFTNVCPSGEANWYWPNCQTNQCDIAVPTAAPTSISTNTIVQNSPTPSSAPYCYLKNKGDGNCDNIINISDYELWRTEFVGTLKGVPIINKPSDFNNDGLITIVDFNIWKTNFQDPSLPH